MKKFKMIFLSLITLATFYDDWYIGRLTASGIVFNQNEYYGASNKYPLGTKIKIKHKEKIVKVKIVDRCNCSLDLSKKAFKKLSSLSKGVINIEVIGVES